jgi:hypothetical protein
MRDEQLSVNQVYARVLESDHSAQVQRPCKAPGRRFTNAISVFGLCPHEPYWDILFGALCNLAA